MSILLADVVAVVLSYGFCVAGVHVSVKCSRPLSAHEAVKFSRPLDVHVSVKFSRPLGYHVSGKFSRPLGVLGHIPSSPATGDHSPWMVSGW